MADEDYVSHQEEGFIMVLLLLVIKYNLLVPPGSSRINETNGGMQLSFSLLLLLIDQSDEYNFIKIRKIHFAYNHYF